MVQFGLEKHSREKRVKDIPVLDNYDNTHRHKRFFMNKLVEFCKRTDLHGYKYIVMKELNYYERCCWGIAVLVSIACAAYFVIIAYRWYARNPIVTVIESTQGAIWNIPFPSITLCNLNVVSKKAARAFADNMTLPENVTVDFVYKALKLIPLLHEPFGIYSEEKEVLLKLQTVMDLNNISIKSLFKILSPASPCSQLIERCMWKNIIYRCEDMFQPIYTMLGLCCTFNYFAYHASLSYKGNGNVNILSNPRRVASCGYQTALTILLNTNPDDYYAASIATQGILVIIENPFNVPDLDSPVRLINPSSEVLIALSPEWTYTSSGIKAFHPDVRQCYYSDEIKVGIFRQYSFHNCMSYSKIETIHRLCDCVPMYYPQKDHRVCNFRDMNCLEYINIGMGNNPQNGTDQDSSLQCLPECEHFDYPLEVALGRLADNVFVNGLPFFDDVSLENRSLLNVFFNDLVSTRYRRDVYLNWQNIFAAYGGLLSLMLGFTLISGFDVILFFTLRVFYDSLKSVVGQNKTHVIDIKERNHKKVSWIATPSEYNQQVFGPYSNHYY